MFQFVDILHSSFLGYPMYTSDENWTRKTSTWVVCFLLSFACLWAAHSHFTQAFPIVSLDIQLDRGGAVDSALEIVEREDWGPKTFEQWDR